MNLFCENFFFSFVSILIYLFLFFAAAHFNNAEINIFRIRPHDVPEWIKTVQLPTTHYHSRTAKPEEKHQFKYTIRINLSMHCTSTQFISLMNYHHSRGFIWNLHIFFLHAHSLIADPIRSHKLHRRLFHFIYFSACNLISTKNEQKQKKKKRTDTNSISPVSLTIGFRSEYLFIY